MPVHFTTHSLARLRQRDVTEAEVRAAFDNPASVAPGAAPGTYVLEANLARGRICVVYAQPERAIRVVVTAYWKGE